MCSVVLLEPHHDDAVLFACYTLLREKPLVVTVLAGETVQREVTGDQRLWESKMAMHHLGVPYLPWEQFSERNSDWDQVGYQMQRLDQGRLDVERVWAPLVEPENGHEQHDELGRLAAEIFGDRCRFYATYKRGSTRTRTDTEVKPASDWPAIKFRAMSCYVSQINLDNCRPWFNDWEREWIA